MLLGLESPFDKSFLGSDLVQRHQLEPLWRAPSRQGRFVPLRPAALMPAAAVALYLNRRLRSQVIHDLNTVNYCT